MRLTTCALLLCCGATRAYADRTLPFGWTSATVEAGHTELQGWLQPSYGRADVTYTRVNAQLQVAQGVTERLDTLFGLDLTTQAFGVDGRTIDPRASNLWRFRLLSADDVVGLAALGRVALGFDALDLELRVAVDKRLGALLLVANAAVTRSAFWASRTGIDTRFEENVGLQYLLADAFGAGVEFRAHSALEQGVYQGTAFSIGPTFGYTSKRWWVTLGVLAQVAADKAKADRGNGEPLEVRDNERFIGRLVIGLKTN